MAANTITIKIDTIEKETWDAILALAGESGSVSVLVDDAETLDQLADASESILALAEKSTELLALLDDSGGNSGEDTGT